jgi:hypothetical protein
MNVNSVDLKRDDTVCSVQTIPTVSLSILTDAKSPISLQILQTTVTRPVAPSLHSQTIVHMASM